MSPVLVHLLRHLVLVGSLCVLGLCHGHLDLDETVLELGVEGVCIIGVEVLGVGRLVEDVDLGEQGDYVALDVLLGDVGQRLDLLELKGLVLIEQQQDAHLVGTHLDLVLGRRLSQDCLHVREAGVVLPCEESACVLVGVELVEVGDA